MLSRLATQPLLRHSFRVGLKPLRFQATLAKPITFSKHILVGSWQIGIAFLTAGAVAIGGITRLTESGLSMTDWTPLTKAWPENQAAWDKEFANYKNSPEYEDLNQGMSLEEFKKIFFWEWFHRKWGNFIGACYIIPYLGFLASGHLKRSNMVGRATGLGLVLGCQGLYGWYMVKSGLDRKNIENRLVEQAATVSPYRLAGHLSLALTLFSGSLYNGLNLLIKPEGFRNTKIANFEELRLKAMKLKRMAPGMTFGVIALSIVSGAFVAGLNAGMIYNNYPHMADEGILPVDILQHSPLWKNLLENPTTVQFEHRLLTHLAFISVLVTFMVTKKCAPILPVRANHAMNAVLGLTCLQVALGITTILTQCHLHVAATHQINSTALLASCIWFLHELKRLPK